MKILFDHQIFSLQIYGGVSKYFCEVLKRLPYKEWETTVLVSNNEYLKKIQSVKYWDFLSKEYFRGKASLMDYINRPYTIYKLKKGDFDVFHQTDFATYYLNDLKGKKMVTTFHDMNYTKYKDLYTNTLTNNVTRREILQKESVKRADKIIAVSHNTKKDLVELWNINPDKITVVHHGVDKCKIENLEKERVTEKPYILYVGERYGFKNFSRFVKAFAIISKKYPDLQLVCTGRAFSEDEKKQMSELKLLGRVLQISADERLMARLYRDAEMFVYPSFSEGFGMPILEAMVYDCPVAVSDATSFPEVAGESGVYFDPFIVDDISEKIESLLTSVELREEKIVAGKRQLEKFSWEKTAQEHMAVYRSLM